MFGAYGVGDRIGGTDAFTGNIYIGTVYDIAPFSRSYWIKVDGGGVMILNPECDKVKRVCKSSEVDYV